MTVAVKTDGTFLGVNYADLGTYKIDGLKVSGQAKQAKAIGWNGDGQDQTGYFIGLHFENCKQFKTANHPEGKKLDADGNLLLLLGDTSPTLKWLTVEDNAGKTDTYTFDVTATS